MNITGTFAAFTVKTYTPMGPFYLSSIPNQYWNITGGGDSIVIPVFNFDASRNWTGVSNKKIK